VSGFTKVMNPKALENVVEHYFVAYGLSMPDWLIDTCAIGLSVTELAIGIMLLFKIFVRIMSIASLVMMSIFTIVTLLNATIFPIDDCGCFGDLISLTSWQSFVKNIVLLPMAVAIWYNYRRELVFETWLRDVIVTCVTIAACLGLTLWNYMGLPYEWADKTPFKKGTDLHTVVSTSNEQSAKVETPIAVEDTTLKMENPHQSNADSTKNGDVVVVYRNNQTNEVREFALEDKAWYALDADQENWTWVETKVKEELVDASAKLDVWFGDGKNDRTMEILDAPKAYLLFMSEAEYDDDIREKFEVVEAHAKANGDLVVYVTPVELSTVSALSSPCLNMDSRVMKLMLRADFGLVILEKGVIKEKYNYRQIPY
jgi:uncharacterized membrane protein YphA (DoxX/SURF4 family)